MSLQIQEREEVQTQEDAHTPMRSYESFIVWKDGLPTVTYRRMLTPDTLGDLPIAALSLPYKRSDRDILLDIDTEFDGMTNAEVMNIRLARKAAGGSLDAAKILQDRILGRPKQQVETHTVSETYTQYLERLAACENAGEEIIDV